MKSSLTNLVTAIIVIAVSFNLYWFGNAALAVKVRETGIILVENLDVQSEPGKRGFLQKRLKKGTRIKIIKHFEGWLQILHAGEVGFIPEDTRFVKIIQESPPQTPKAQKEKSQTTDRQIDALKQKAQEIDRKIETGKAKLEIVTQKEIDTINRLRNHGIGKNHSGDCGRIDSDAKANSNQ
jgi:hypothetical protein